MFSKQNIWLTFLLSIVFIAVLGQLLPKNAEKYLGERFWTLKTFAKPVYNLVIVGDSRTYRGISPDEINAELPGIKGLNFAYSNGGLNNLMFDAAEAKLDQNSKQNIILIGVSAFSLNPLSTSNKHYLQEYSRPREDVLERKYLNKYLNFFSPVTPEEVQDLIKGVRPSINYISVYHDNGWVESEKTPADTMEAMPYYKKDFSQYATDYELLDGLCERILQWRTKGIQVFAFRPPASVPLIALEDSAGQYNEAVIKERIEGSGGVWIPIKPTDYKTYDGSHLYKGEAEKLSKYLGIEMNQELIK